MRIGELRRVLRERRARPIERGLIGARIDLRQQLPALDLLAFLEGDLGELAIHLRGHLDRVERLHGAEPLKIDRHVPRDDRRGGDFDRLR